MKFQQFTTALLALVACTVMATSPGLGSLPNGLGWGPTIDTLPPSAPVTSTAFAAQRPQQAPPPLDPPRPGVAGLSTGQDTSVDGLILEFVGQLGGPIRAVAARGSVVLAGMGTSVLALDTSNPKSPVVIGRSPPLPTAITEIATLPESAYAYVAAGGAGFYVLDVTDLTALRPVGHYLTFCEAAGLALSPSGDRAYLAEMCSPGLTGLLEVIAIDEPAEPIHLGSFSMPAQAYDVDVAGETVYAVSADRQGGLWVVDMSDPMSPAELGFIGADFKWLAVAVAAYPADSGTLSQENGLQDTQVIALAGGRDGVSVLDVSDPADAQDLGLFCATRGQVRDIAISGNSRAYAVDDRGGLCVLNITDPTLPVEAAKADVPGFNYAVAVHDTSAYIASNERLAIIDVAGDQVNPQGDFGAAVDVADLAVFTAGSTTYAYIADKWQEGGLLVADVTNPRRPWPLSYLRLDGPVQGVAVTHDRALAAANSPARLVTIDIANPSQPVETSSIVLPNAVLDVVVSPGEDFAYLGNQGYGVRIYSLDDADPPGEISRFQPAQYPEALMASGRYLYVAGGLERKAYRINVASPAAPTLSATWDTQGWTHDVTATGGRTYVAAGGYGLQIYPDDIRLILNNTFSVDTASHFALVVDKVSYNEAWLHAIAVSEQTGPIVTSGHKTLGQGWQVVVPLRSNYAYVADGTSGVSIFAMLRDRMTATVGPEGGSLTSHSGDAVMIFPTGAFSDTVELTYRRLLADQNTGDLAGIGRTFEVTGTYTTSGEAAGLEPDHAYSMMVRYTDDDIRPVSEETLALYRWDGVQWVREPSSALHPSSNTLTASPERLGLFAVLGEARWRYLPLLLGGNTAPPLPTPMPTPAPPLTPPVPFSVRFRLSPTVIDPGGQAILTWDVQGAREVFLDGESVPFSGTRVVSPVTTTTYVLRAIRPDGAVQEERQTLIVAGSSVTPTTTPTVTSTVPAEHG